MGIFLCAFVPLGAHLFFDERIYRRVPRRYHSFLPARIWIFWALFLVRGDLLLGDVADRGKAGMSMPISHGCSTGATMVRCRARPTRISREIDESMRLAPLPWELTGSGRRI